MSGFHMVSTIDVGMNSLAVLALLAVLEFLGLRAPIRGGIVSAWGWLTAKALALRSEVRLFVAFVFRPDPPMDPKDVPPWRPEDTESVEFAFPIRGILGPFESGTSAGTYRVTWDDGEKAAPKPRKPRKRAKRTK